MPLGLLDLSIVTDRLIKLLQDCVDTTLLWQEEATITPEGTPSGATPGQKFQIEITGAPPDTIRKGSVCQLSLYLFHVARDKYQTNAPVMGPRAQVIPQQPLSLDLYYLLTAYSEGRYIEEQQAMSIALKCFHDHPIVRATVPFGNATVQEEFTLTMEVETADELGRLWQAITSSLRLATVYKVSVVFLTPEQLPQAAPPVQTFALSVNPTALPYASQGQVIGTFLTVRYTGPDDTPAKPDRRNYDLVPAAVAPGQTFLLFGSGFKPPSPPIKLYLLPASGPEQDVSGWISADPNLSTDARLTLTLPTVGAPAPGVYQLRIGFGAYRSNSTPFSVAALVDPSGGPLLTPDAGGTFTLNGAGFIAGQTEVLLDTAPLAETGGAPNPGEFQVAGGGTSIGFRRPGDLPAGRYGVRVRVNDVEAAPAKWIVVP